MHFKFSKKIKQGFTLLEILLVVGIISLLAGIVIVAINPGKQLASVRNTQRQSDIKQLNSAITQYYISTGRYPTSIQSIDTLTEICDTGTATTSSTCGSLVNLTALVPTYITAIPKDPQGPVTALNKIINTVYAATGGTGYYVMKDSNNKIVVNTEKAELGAVIAIGTTTAMGEVTVVPETGCTATGGTIDTESAPGYKIHTFTTVGSDTFMVTSDSCDVEVLVVAGGGSGGSYYGGGGGAGGLIYQSNITLTSGSKSVIVGAGGVGTPSIGANGSNSMFDIYTAIGGGYGAKGGGTINAPVGSGGSGGGGGAQSYHVPDPGGLGTEGQGNNGGTSPGTIGNYASGGGGGAGSVGVSPVDYDSPGGDGGSGLEYSISGVAKYYAGGGGGQSLNGPASSGGSGIGGNGGTNNSVGGAGTPNTGSGGGGGGPGTGDAAGGSGIVIVRYAI